MPRALEAVGLLTTRTTRLPLTSKPHLRRRRSREAILGRRACLSREGAESSCDVSVDRYPVSQSHNFPFYGLHQLHDDQICHAARLQDWAMPAHLADRGADMCEMVAARDQRAKVRLRRRKHLDAAGRTPARRCPRGSAYWGRRRTAGGGLLEENCWRKTAGGGLEEGWSCRIGTE